SIDFFLSHSWSADGFWKQAAIYICFSTAPAYKLMMLSSILVLLVGCVSFLIGLLVNPLFKHRNTMVFLDICCIPQKDPVAKLYGISKLAEYLRASDKLLILWSPDYLDRLWCVYELAVFLRTHDKKDVVLVNLNHIKLCVSLMFLQLFSILTLCLQLHYESTHNPYIGYLLGLVTSILIGREAFTCSKEWRKFCSRVRRFSVREAKCTSLADYYTLKQLITDMYRSEAEFAAVVRCLWLGGGKAKSFPTWLFSWASLRIMCAPYIPLIVACAVDYIVCIATEESFPMVPTYSQSQASPVPA
ncbi:hypothetical protein FOZ62_025848, partial [Perkinsus olseni]